MGAYQRAIAEASEAGPLDPSAKDERDVLVYRAYIGQGLYKIVLDEIGEDASTAMQAVKLLAKYYQFPEEKESILATLQEWMEDPSRPSNPTLLLVAATIYAREENHVEALKCANTGSPTLDMMALSVALYLKIDRVDFAEKQVKAMAAIDDDATITQLCTAWTNLALGGAKVQEAFYIFQELGEKNTWTAKLLVGNAAAHILMGQYEEAERDLLDALQKDPKDIDALANLVVCCQHLGKPTSRYANQLNMLDLKHPVLTKQAGLLEAFEASASAYQ